MNTTILIVLGEAIFILAMMLLTILWIAWKRKKNNQEALEQLLDTVSEQEQARKSWLISYLTSRHQINSDSASTMCEGFIEAEKQFIHGFLEQQMKQTPINGFYDNLCELLNKYLSLLPSTDENSAEGAETGKVNEKDAVLFGVDSVEPDWDAVFAEIEEEQNNAEKWNIGDGKK